jgi:ribosomal protein S15P/S13E
MDLNKMSDNKSDHEVRITELEKSVKDLQKLVNYLTTDKKCPTKNLINVSVVTILYIIIVIL